MREFVVLIPVKPPVRGKSRLAGVEASDRIALATAFARDCIAAAREAKGVAEVMVVTDDVRFATEVRADGCAVIPDGVSGSLNATLVQAAAESRRRWPAYSVAALCADLPALRPGDLSDALAQVDDVDPWFVTDHVGSGTTMYAAAPEVVFTPQFGPDSRLAHLEFGAREILGDLATLRLDVDDLADLDLARGHGLGPHTGMLLDEASRD
jgi:2-phospho-L-lactate guanylyltransferase